VEGTGKRCGRDQEHGLADGGWRGVLHAIDLAERHRLTVYDALYLQLAMDVEAPIATLDRGLAAAALAEGIEVID
jgi:predicted nucleic acid-binding protein